MKLIDIRSYKVDELEQELRICSSRRNDDGELDVGIDIWKRVNGTWTYLGRRYGYDKTPIQQPEEWQEIVKKIKESHSN
ncbi:hypothetical protein PU629_12530 [Pullulanibacillus sp. KACC 23026]|uniref:hypothetical protein n=1 Tax=Pullulanibacillus sp. KACC 23026 TaxID=3028315 RepID=UPI0023AEBDD6|nr:hypothetical protein [Pullulanibacillus sp. KACC 23026]WEG11003.1 hypothetical protein PU629_12530 [Pullulanibacillus sp. KACC 23026]